MPLIRLIFSAFITAGILFYVTFAHAEEHLALGASLPDPATAPLVLSTARNIQLVIVSDNDLLAQNLWERIRNGFSMRNLNSPLVAKHEKWYASRPEYIARMT